MRSGDSLWLIARHHKVSVRQLAKWNNLTSNALIKPGQQLTLREPSVSVPSANSGVNPVYYTVRKGDSLFLISRKYNVSIADLKEWNGLRNARLIKPGQKLKLYVDIARLAQNDQG